jgi:hypothetical protein
MHGGVEHKYGILNGQPEEREFVRCITKGKTDNINFLFLV